MAVDKRLVPLGSIVLIDGRQYLAHDTGSAIKGRRVDIYMRSHLAARHFGSRRRRVEVIRRGDPRYRDYIMGRKTH